GFDLGNGGGNYSRFRGRGRGGLFRRVHVLRDEHDEADQDQAQDTEDEFVGQRRFLCTHENSDEAGGAAYSRGAGSRPAKGHGGEDGMSGIIIGATAAGFVVFVESILQRGGNIFRQTPRDAGAQAVFGIDNAQRQSGGEVVLSKVGLGIGV